MKFNLSEIAEGRLTQEQTDSLQKYFTEGGTWQDLMELSPEQVEEVYAIGFKEYNDGNFEKAISAFGALVQLNPYVPKHWIAMGATMQARGSFAEALTAYEFVLILDEKDAAALFYSAQCSYALNEKQKCIEFLQRAIELQDGTFSEKSRQILTAIGG